MEDALEAVFLFAFGLAIGSFLNVVIHRAPRGISVVSPVSACPECGHPVRGFDNVPVLSWVLLKGRCRDCGAPVSARYPAVELLTGVLFVAVGARLPTDAVLGAWLVVTAGGIALAAIDLELKRLPFNVTVPTAGLSAGLLVVDAVARSADPAPRAFASAGLWFGLYWLLWFASAGRAMGFGDVVLAPVLGLALGWLGWGPALVGLLGGFFVGAVVGGGLMLTGVLGRRAKIPHGPFMLAGAALGLFAGPEIWASYLGSMGR